MENYIDNILYGSYEESVDDLAEELAGLAGLEAMEIYDALHAKILREIKLSELGITVIMPDLIEILGENYNRGKLVMEFVANPVASYSELGSKMGISKQRVAVVLGELSKKYRWMKELLEIHNRTK